MVSHSPLFECVPQDDKQNPELMAVTNLNKIYGSFRAVLDSLLLCCVLSVSFDWSVPLLARARTRC